MEKGDTIKREQESRNLAVIRILSSEQKFLGTFFRKYRECQNEVL